MAGFRERRERLALQAQQVAIMQGEQVKLTAPSSYESLEIVLKTDLNKIRALPSLAQRAEYKRLHFLPKFLPLVEEYQAKGERYQNDVLGYCLMYLFDVGDFEKGLQLAEFAIADGQAMPEGILRKMAHFVADSVLEFTDKATSKGESSEPYFSQTLDKITNVWNVSEIVMAKYYKTASKLLLLAREQNGQVKTALVNEPKRLEFAIYAAVIANAYNHRIGVNSQIERCFMRLNALIQGGIYTDEQLKTFSEKIKSLQEGQASGFNAEELQAFKTLLRSPSLTFAQVREQAEAEAEAEAADEQEQNEGGNV